MKKVNNSRKVIRSSIESSKRRSTNRAYESLRASFEKEEELKKLLKEQNATKVEERLIEKIDQAQDKVEGAMNIINCTDDDDLNIGNFFSLSEVDVNYRSKALPKNISTRGVGVSAPPPDIIIKTKNLGQSLISLKKLLT